MPLAIVRKRAPLLPPFPPSPQTRRFKQMVNVTRNVEVPFITNAIDVEAGEELLLEKPVDAPTLQKPTKGKTQPWKTAAANLVKKAEPLKGSKESRLNAD